MKRSTVLAATFLLALGASRTSAAQTAARELYLEGRDHLIEERFDQALARFRRVVIDHPTSEEADDAQYYVGYVLAELGRNDEAVAAFANLLERWPESVRVDRARARRAELLASQENGSTRDDVLRDVFEGESSWQLKRDTAFALARQGNLTAAAVLAEAMERESSSRQIELARLLAPFASDPAARRILVLGLDAGRSSSVQLRALQSLEPVASEDAVAVAIGRLLSNGAPSSVQQHAVLILARHVGAAGARRALAEALAPDHPSSVQIHACRALSGHLLSPEVRPAVTRVFQSESSSSARLRCLESLAPDVHEAAAAEVLREAIVHASNSSSVRFKAIQLAGSSPTAAVREVAQAGLERSNASSVQLHALRAIASDRDDERAAEALDSLFRETGASTSVLIAAIDALAHHMGTRAGPAALGRALATSHSTSVRLHALRLASGHIASREVRDGVLAVLEEDSASTSVQLEAISMLSAHVDDPEVRRIVGRAIRPGNSTSVLLKAVEALGAQAAEADTRDALVRGLDADYSTSVVLASLSALSPRVAGDGIVRDAFVRTMEDGRMSYTARVRAAERLLPGADAALEARIADAMEDVVSRARSRGQRGHRDLIDGALEVLEGADPERARNLRSRERSGDARPREIVARGAPLWPPWPAPMM